MPECSKKLLRQIDYLNWYFERRYQKNVIIVAKCIVLSAVCITDKMCSEEHGRNCLYFYPKEYIEEAQKRGIADKETVMKRSKWFMIPFCIIIFVALILIISVWNHVMDFKTAYLQACLFLVVMNWFDGIVIDRLWVGHSRIWHIDGMEGIPYVKSWKTVLVKRGAATVLYLVVAFVVAGIVELLGKI